MGCAIGSLRPQDDAQVTVSLVSDVTGTQPLAATVSAGGDSNKSNDSAATTFKVDPNVDIGIGALPVQSRVRVSSTVDYVFSLVTATQSVASATARVSSDAPASIVAATPSQGSCTPAGAEFLCTFGALPANAEVTVAVRLRGEQSGFSVVTIVATAGGDVDPGNSTGSTILNVDGPGNVSVAAAPASVTTAVGTIFDLPTIRLTAITQTENVRLNFTIPASFTVESALAEGAPCAVNAGSIACSFGTLPAGANRGVNLRLRANQSGEFSAGVNATAEYDSDTSNNSMSIAITVNAVPPPNPTPIGTGNVSITAAQGSLTTAVGAAFDLPTITLTAIAQTADVRVNWSIPASFTVDSALAGGAPCAVNAGAIVCSFGTLPAGTTRSVNVRLRASASGAFAAGVNATAEYDSDTSNNSTSIGITVNTVPSPNPIPTPTGNVSVAAAQGSMTATVGTAFDLPRSTDGDPQTAEVRVSLSIPASFTVESALADGAPCTVGSGTIICSLGTLPAGTTRSVNVRLRASQSGAFAAGVNATAEFDLDGSNNSTSIAVIVNAAPPNPVPTPTPSPSPSPSGGGGGGSVDWFALLAMLGLAARVRPVARAGRQRERRY